MTIKYLSLHFTGLHKRVVTPYDIIGLIVKGFQVTVKDFKLLSHTEITSLNVYLNWHKYNNRGNYPFLRETVCFLP